MKYFTKDIATFLGDEKARAGQPLVLCLNGPLGAGKTTFAKEFLAHFGFDPAQVQSPTFLKLLEYEVPALGVCLHLDCYRIVDSEELEKLALETYSHAQVWLVEWPEKFLEFLSLRTTLRKTLGIASYWDFEFREGLGWSLKYF